jgi:tetratricopeptide (TPR) repeat protein
MAQLDRSQGRLVEAGALYARLLELSRHVLDRDDPLRLSLMNNLAMLHLDRAELDRAEPLLTQALEGSQRALGDDHPDTLTAMAKLADVYYDQGRLDEARRLFERVLAARREMLGEGHRETLATMNQLASIAMDRGRFDEAASLFARVLDGYRRALGNDHPNTLASLYDMALVEKRRGRFAEAEPLLVELVGRDGQGGRPGLETELRAFALSLRGAIRIALGKFVEAEPDLRWAFAIRRTTSPDDWANELVRSLLGGCLAAKRNFAEAEPHLLESYEGMRARLGSIPEASRGRLAEAGERIVQLYEAWGKPEKAADWRERLARAPV